MKKSLTFGLFIYIICHSFAFADAAKQKAVLQQKNSVEQTRSIQKMERTLSIIKPDGVKRNLMGKIIGQFEESGLRVVATKMKRLSRHEAEGFYAVHKERPFFKDLVESMTSGPVLLMVLEGENAILKNREIMGATDPQKAAAGTIRKQYALSIGENTVHGSDAPETAQFEIAWFFPQSEVGR